MVKVLRNFKNEQKKDVFFWRYKEKLLNLYRVFHGIRLLRLIKIGCRETINFFCHLWTSILVLCELYLLVLP